MHGLLPVLRLRLDLNSDDGVGPVDAVNGALRILAVDPQPWRAIDFSKVPGLLASILTIVKRARPDQASTTDVALGALRVLTRQASCGRAALLVRMGALSHVHALMANSLALQASRRQAKARAGERPQLQSRSGRMGIHNAPDSSIQCFKLAGAAAITLLNLYASSPLPPGPAGCGQNLQEVQGHAHGGQQHGNTVQLPDQVVAALSALADMAVDDEVRGVHWQ